MPSYNVLLKDGTSATVEAPPNATKQQLAEAVNRQKDRITLLKLLKRQELEGQKN